MLTRRIVVGYVAGFLTMCVVMNLLTPHKDMSQSVPEKVLHRRDIESKFSQLSVSVKSTTKAHDNSRHLVMSVDKPSPKGTFSETALLTLSYFL